MFLVLWLASVSLSVWVGTEKGVRLAWDLMSRSRITLHLCAKAVKTKKPRIDFGIFNFGPQLSIFQVYNLCMGYRL